MSSSFRKPKSEMNIASGCLPPEYRRGVVIIVDDTISSSIYNIFDTDIVIIIVIMYTNVIHIIMSVYFINHYHN